MIRSAARIAHLLVFAAILVFGSMAAATMALAQSPPSLDATQLLGRRLYGNHCVVCHEKPQITSIQFGPSLSRDSLGGQEDVMREVIGNGTPRMPGFKHHFTAAQIAAIAAYLKTVPAPPAAAPNAPR